MKKFLYILLMFSLMLCLVACGEKDLPLHEEINSTNNFENKNTQQGSKKYFEKSLLNQYAETQIIKLPENPTTGYEWVYIVDDSEVVNIMKDEYQLLENAESIVGTGGHRVCELKGLKEGNTIVYFNYIRGFEVDEEPVESFKLYVSVNSSNEIAITDEIH